MVLDIETTGLSKYRHKITEIAGVRVRKGKIIAEYQTLVNPEVHIPSFITRLTGIDDKLVKDAPPIEKVLPGFVRFLGKNVFVAHNATFDHGFLYHNAQAHMNYVMTNNTLCTRKLANRLLPELPSKKLSCVCEHLAVRNINAHRALADAKATADIFIQFMHMMKQLGFKTVDDIQKFETLPLERIRKIVATYSK